MLNGLACSKGCGKEEAATRATADPTSTKVTLCGSRAAGVCLMGVVFWKNHIKNLFNKLT